MVDKALLEQFRQAYRDLELFPLLTAEQIEAFRVDYSGDTVIRLEQAVENAPPNGKVIFAGHRGCGKSTLLAKFARQMMQQGYFVVFFSIADLIEMSAVNHVNILYTIALSLLSKATERQVAIPEETRKSLLDWFTTTQTDIVTKELKQEVGVGGDFFKLFTAKLKNEDTFREEIRKTYQNRIGDLAKKADEIAGFIQAATKKEVLVVIDDLDKLDLELVENIYKDNINSLFLPKFRIVFTIPISAIRNNDVLAVLQSIGPRIQLMSVSKFYNRVESHKPDSVPQESKVDLFLQVLYKRIPDDLIEPATARNVVLKSGGVIRELVRIARECCNECTFLIRTEPDRQDIKINDDVLTAALKNLRNEFARPLGMNLYNLLAETYKNLKPADAKSPEFLSLLHGLYVLEYENDDLWYDIHPIVVDLLKRENLI
ncbi:ATP-binding protein [Oculatella sp. LEGE 06141]|uniref:ATP-binding protein n=1 Tax=Oculatella sp. LEGE 06141 TaxID=1828648 RepID=UPI00187F6FCA|nr:ATP-binding protein [Oculatella sp. LEGE 06141]MBE9181895.1 ATP-binding protein [Oculatella sp. LEGE 06141]